MRINVQGGTNAGWRVAREARTDPWLCKCGYTNKPTYTRCFGTGCNGKRP